MNTVFTCAFELLETREDQNLKLSKSSTFSSSTKDNQDANTVSPRDAVMKIPATKRAVSIDD